MRRKPSFGLTVLGTIGSALLGGLASASAADRIETRTCSAPDGESYWAVSLSAEGLPARAVPHDHVVLVDTSASQMGEHRTQGLAVVRSVLSALPANDRVAVFAVDLKATSLTDGLVSPSAALAAALPQLESRFPAGSTDLPAAMNAALATLEGGRTASILYVGDGMSTADLLQVDELRALVDALLSRRVAVHSFAVGSQTDLQLLGVLALQTGGVILVDDASQPRPAAESGARLARAMDLPVAYPDSLQVAGSGMELLPAAPLPLRSDRATVYLGRGTPGPSARITLSVPRNGRTQDIAWNLPARGELTGGASLVLLWNRAAQTNGLSNSLAGDEMLAFADAAFADGVADLEAQAQAALSVGRTEEAARIGVRIQQLDPQNVRAATFVNANSDVPVRTVAQADPVPPTPSDLQNREGPRAISPLDVADQRQRVLTQRLEAQVEDAIAQSRLTLPTEPLIAQSLLEDTLGAVKAATDIDPESRARLLRVVDRELQAATGQLEARLVATQDAQRRVAVQQAQERLLDATMQQELRTRNLVDRVRALMLQGYEGNPDAFEGAEAVSRMIANERPGSAIGAATVFTSEAAGQIDKANHLRSLRSDRFLATLYQTELSHVPFPDEPPIRYPPAEVWQALTANRKKWKSVDLHQNSPNERRIYEELDKPTSVEFPGNPLRDVLEYISQVHDFPILIDETAFTDAGISADEEVNIVLSGIKLRSALKLLLESASAEPLAYVVEDEVMKITTKEKADEILQTRVYPVADLVIPIQTLSGGGGFGGGIGAGGGGFGGGQQGGGGFGGQGGGGGGFGGGGGGFGGGGGGGFFSVPDPTPGRQAQPQATEVFDAGTVNRLKKKPAGRN